VKSRQAWDVGIGAFVGAVLGDISGRLTMGPQFGLYVGVALMTPQLIPCARSNASFARLTAMLGAAWLGIT